MLDVKQAKKIGLAWLKSEQLDNAVGFGLPEIDGWEATRRLKAADETKQIPIIALTAHAMAGDREKALQAGSDEYDTKPVDFKRLLEKINMFIQE